MVPVRPRRQRSSPSNPRLRVLIASHSHPEVTNGGSEIAAHEIFRALRDRDDCESWFLGCDRTANHAGATFSQPYSDREYVYNARAFDWFKFANHDLRFRAEIERLFIALAPDVVHFHHFANFGVEVFAHLRRVLPNCKIILTLHEFLAICHHFGQMVTTRHFNLCHRATDARCHDCFPDIDRSDFFLRKRYILRFLELVDVFVAPSTFLAERYVAWGLPADKLIVLENLMPSVPPASIPVPASNQTLRIGFFGQISKLKGIDVVFDAAAALARQKTDEISFEIYGDYRGQPPEFQTEFLDRLQKADVNVRFHGPYDRSRVDRLMQSVHAVLVPSVWWENSPVVIQEAFRNRRPVICSDIGGMAEKVRDGIDGFHFPVGSAMALTALLRGLVVDRSILSDLSAGLTGPKVVASSLDDYLALYRGMRLPTPGNVIAASG